MYIHLISCTNFRNSLVMLLWLWSFCAALILARGHNVFFCLIMTVFHTYVHIWHIANVQNLHTVKCDIRRIVSSILPLLLLPWILIFRVSMVTSYFCLIQCLSLFLHFLVWISACEPVQFNLWISGGQLEICLIEVICWPVLYIHKCHRRLWLWPSCWPLPRLDNHVRTDEHWCCNTA